MCLCPETLYSICLICMVFVGIEMVCYIFQVTKGMWHFSVLFLPVGFSFLKESISAKRELICGANIWSSYKIPDICFTKSKNLDMLMTGLVNWDCEIGLSGATCQNLLVRRFEYSIKNFHLLTSGVASSYVSTISHSCSESRKKQCCS